MHSKFFNFLVTWGLRYQLQFSILCAYFVYTRWHCTGQHCMYACTYHLPVCGAPGERYYNTLSCCEIIFHRWVWYRALSLCYACIRSSGITLIP